MNRVLGFEGGLSITELLLVVGLAAMLASLAAPGFASLRRAAAVDGSAHEMLASLHLARSSSILRGVPTVLCLSGDGRQCLERAGTPGIAWLVFIDSTHELPIRVTAGDELIRTVRAPTDVQVRGTRSAVTFWPVSRMGTTGTFRICHRADARVAREVVVSQTGRPRVEDAAGDEPCEG